MALTDKLTAIADAIRGKTGKTDGLTLDQMATEIAGIGQGSSDGGASGIYMAKVTMADNVGSFNVMHNLGTKDILFALCFANDLNGITPASENNIIAKSWMNTNINVRYGLDGGFNTMYKYSVANERAELGSPANGVYWDAVVDENTFKFHRGVGGYTYIAGVTYTIIIMAASAFADMGV